MGGTQVRMNRITIRFSEQSQAARRLQARMALHYHMNREKLPTYPIVGIGFVGKSNKPIFIHSFEDDRDSDLELNLTIHSCLDVVEERAEPTQGPYLGFLALMGRHSVYGMIGTTRMKVFCVLDADFEPSPRDEDMKQLLQSLHHAYADWMCNPFVEIIPSEGEPLPSDKSPHFFDRIRKACEAHNFVQK